MAAGYGTRKQKGSEISGVLKEEIKNKILGYVEAVKWAREGGCENLARKEAGKGFGVWRRRLQGF